MATEARTLRLAVIAGDGIGPEVVAEGLKVLGAVAPSNGFRVEPTHYDLGARRWHATGETLPDSVLEELRGHDAILLGAVGDPSVPSGVLERGLLLRLRFELDHHVNLRPVRLLPGVTSPLAGVKPGDIDMVVVREGTEGPYAGSGGFLRKGTPHEVATEESLNTRFGVERVVRDAFARAAARPRRLLTLVHKNNVLTHAGDLWTRTVAEVAADFPAVRTDYLHVDAAAMFFITQPQRFDVVVTDNLFGDIITDIGAAIAGGIGLAASGNLDVSRHEPEHVRAGARFGARHRRAGQGRSDGHGAVRRDAARPPRPARRSRTGRCRGRRRPGRAGRQCGAYDVRDRRRTRHRRGLVTTVDAMTATDLIALKPTGTPLAAAERESRLAEPGFGRFFTDHMVTVAWDAGQGWHDAQLVPYAPLSMDPAIMVLHYGQAIFEGLKAYRQPDGGIATFRPEQNARRFQRSARTGWRCPSCPRSSSSRRSRRW